MYSPCILLSHLLAKLHRVSRAKSQCLQDSNRRLLTGADCPVHRNAKTIRVKTHISPNLYKVVLSTVCTLQILESDSPVGSSVLTFCKPGLIIYGHMTSRVTSPLRGSACVSEYALRNKTHDVVRCRSPKYTLGQLTTPLGKRNIAGADVAGEL